MKKKTGKENKILGQGEIPGQSAGEASETKEKKKFSFKSLKFFKKKKFYVILIIVFSVLLAADIIFGSFFKMTGAFSSMGMMGFGSFGTDISTDADTSSDDSDSSDSDVSDFSDIDSSGMPDMDSADMPGEMGDISSEGESVSADDASSDDASSGDASSDSAADDASSENGAAGISGLPSGDMPDSDASFGDISEDGTDTAADFSTDASADVSAAGLSSGGFRTWLGSYYLIIAIILALLDIAAIVNLIVLSKKLKAQAKEALKEQAREEGRIYIERGPAKKERNAKTSWIIPVAVVIAVILVVNLISSGSASTVAQTSASDLSGTVETGTIETTVPGTGTLTAQDSVEVSFAGSVEVTKWYVSNGDSVSEGDTLAKVDTVTVLNAIAAVQDAIETIDEEIASHEDDSISDTITAGADGRVKAVYAESGTSVVDTMYEYGALIVISLDGLMAVDIETDELSAGDGVTVTLSDGSEEEGTVYSAANGSAVITLSDEDADIDESVTVSDSDGNEIGTGTLYVHSALNITGFSGTVSSVSVSEGDEVSSGDTLISLEDTDYTAEYEALVETRSQLSEQIADLFQIYATGYIYAECDGIISGVDESLTDSSEDSESSDEESDESDSSDDSADADATSLDAQTEEISIDTVNLSAAETSESEDDDEDEEASDDESGEDNAVTVGYVVSVEFVSDEEEEDSGETSSEEEIYESASVTLATLSGETAVVEIDAGRYLYTYDESGFVQADLSYITAGSIIFYVSDETLPIYVFSFAQASDDGEDEDEDEDDGGSSQNGENGESSGEAGSTADENTSSDSDDSSLSSQLQSVFGTDSDQASDTGDSDTAQAADAAQSTDMSASATDASESLTTSTEGETSTTEETVSTSYSVSETTLCAITPQDYMTVTITVDELDVLSLEAGQSALVTLDAYTGQSFDGEVTSVSLSPTNSGGNSKYTAVIRIEKTEDMLAGMNASVSITIDSTEDVLIIPAAAVFEEDGVSYVYTAFDEKSGTYSGAVEVTLGASDGEYVEVTDGLSEGDTYYYSYLDTVNYSSTIVTGSSGTIDFSSFMQQ